MKNFKLFSLSPVMCVFLVACGGGGGPSAPTDTTAPVITITGSASINHEQGTTYTDEGATATDAVDGSVTVSTSGSVDDAAGTYTITYSATDSSGNAATATRTVIVADTIAPIITLNGAAAVTHEQGTTYVDEGATATDSVDTAVEVVTTGAVNAAIAGEYTLTYTATDQAGNASSATRTVVVSDTTVPVVSLIGPATLVHEQGTIYSDPGATAIDSVDGSINIVVTGSVGAAAGSYVLTYSATDSAGNGASASRTVIVSDSTSPTITLIGEATVNHEQGTTYIDSGATAVDTVDGVIAVTSSGSVGAGAGTYTITYSASDAVGNSAVAVRTVIVGDTIAPVITLSGDAEMTHEQGTTYTDAGASAADTVDTSVDVVTTGSVDSDTAGTYTVTYTATDAAGNIATAVTRKVTVGDTTVPVITLTGDASVNHEQATAYTDEGATVTDTVDTSVEVVTAGAVDIATAGTYTLTYSATDSAGNEATTVTRAVTVADTIAPVIVLNGAANISHEQGMDYTDAGAVASDVADGTVMVVTTGTVNTATAGTYTLTYNARDSAGNAAIAVTRTVTVSDTTAPVISSSATFSAAENQTAIGTVTATDTASSDITFTISGSELTITSGGTLTFATAPDYETKTSYTATVTVTDGINSTTQSITVSVTNIGGDFKGTTIDGYVSGATIFIDQNYNFIKDTGELSTVTDSNGKFEINTDDVTLYECLKSRPIIASVPVGAVDSTRGEVTKAYEMILPSINDTGSEAIVISPFTSLLSQAIIAGKSQANLAENLSISQGCAAEGDAVSAKVSSEISTLLSAMQSNFGLTKSDITGDFIASAGAIVNEAKAQKIANFYPYLKSITDSINTDLTTTYGKSITTDLALKDSAITSILSSDNFDDLPIDFSTRWQTTPSSNGWYTEETIRAYGATISADGNLKDHQCKGTVDECTSKDYGLSSLADASQKWLKIVRFRNNTGIAGYEGRDIEFNIEDDRRSVIDLGAETRDCVKKEEIKLYDAFDSSGGRKHFRYSTGHVFIDVNTHECDPLYTGTKDLFLALSDAKPTADGGSESIELQYQNADIANTSIISNVVVDPYTNRASIDLKSFLDEVASMPRYIGDVESIRNLITPASGDRACINFMDKDAQGNIITSSTFCVNLSEGSGYRDQYVSTTQTYDSDGNRTSVSESTRIYDTAAITALRNILSSSENFNENDYLEQSILTINSSVLTADENQTSVSAVSFYNPGGKTLTWTLAGTDSSYLNINSGSGLLVFIGNPDYETKTSYAVTLTATDGTNSYTQDITINITDVDDVTPVFSSSASFTAAENQTAIGTVTATDADSSSITFTVSGSELSITSAGVLTFATAPDYETKTSYTATVTATDGINSTTQSITVSITDVDDTAPVITLIGDASVSLNVGATYSDAGATAEDNIDGTITSSITIVNSVNVATVGTYTVTYDVTDAAGNSAVQVTRTVTVASAGLSGFALPKLVNVIETKE